MSRRETWADSLLEAARQRDIVFSDEEVHTIKAAKPGSPLAKWVHKTLIDTSPFSAEEYALFVPPTQYLSTVHRP